jgi:hypothetical protein
MRLLRSVTKIALKKNHGGATKAFLAGHASRSLVNALTGGGKPKKSTRKRKKR